MTNPFSLCSPSKEASLLLMRRQCRIAAGAGRRQLIMKARSDGPAAAAAAASRHHHQRQRSLHSSCPAASASSLPSSSRMVGTAQCTTRCSSSMTSFYPSRHAPIIASAAPCSPATISPILIISSPTQRNNYKTFCRSLASAAASAAPSENAANNNSNSNNNNNSNTDDDGRPPIIWTTHRLSKDQIAKVDAIFHKVLWLDMFETSMLTDCINERLGITVTAKQRLALERLMEGESVGGGGGKGGKKATDGEEGEEAKEEVKSLFDIKLVSFDAKAKIKVIKEVRALAGLGLKEAKEMVESAPKVVMKEVKKEQVDEIKEKLEAVGATIEVA